MIISLSFSSKFLTGYSKSYLEEFIRFSQNKVAEIYPDCQLKIRSLGQIYVSSVNLSELTYIAYPVSRNGRTDSYNLYHYRAIVAPIMGTICKRKPIR